MYLNVSDYYIFDVKLAAPSLTRPMITCFDSILLSSIPFRIDAGALRRVDILVGRDTISIFIFRQNRAWVHIGAQCFILGKVVYNS